MRRLVAIFALATAALVARADRILLVPLDSRPAAGQFAQMIGSMANCDVRMPEYTTLGRFTTPGSPNSILHWLKTQDYSDVGAVVVSADMIAYGGLIASRTSETPKAVAMQRLAELAEIRAAHPKVRFYVFSSIMRLLPTATRQTEGWRLALGKYEECLSRYKSEGDAHFYRLSMQNKAKVPKAEIARYEETRVRNLEVCAKLVRMIGQNKFDYLAFGQDDARPYGPHQWETKRLKQIVQEVGGDDRVYFCEGIDQHSNVLLSRALLSESGWKPRIKIVYSDEDGRSKYANFETKDIEHSLDDQIIASGAVPVANGETYDFALYVNTPRRRDATFKSFLSQLDNEIVQGFPVAVADINLAKDGTADPELFSFLSQNDRMIKLLSFAGWNTAGNSMGTAIPAANIYLLSRRINTDPLERELARRAFLLHRFVNDYAYHKFVRPQAYSMIDASHNATRDETYGRTFRAVDQFVRADVSKYLEHYWHEEFEGKRFFAGTQQYELTGISNVRIFLPWPRAYEVRLEFQLHAEPVTTAESRGK